MPVPTQATRDASGSRAGVIEAALEIGRKRRKTLARMRAALEQGNDAGARKLARELCGMEIENGQERHRTDPRVN